MAFWEFLLQKDGDRSWLPLESPTVEILEGRYRVVGRSSRTNTSVEIRIAHSALTELIPVRRTQKRSSCTNQDGLVVIMPFTQLQPGDWELYCIGDLMADMMGEGWQYGVKLQVLPVIQDAEVWEPDPHEMMATALANQANDHSDVQQQPSAPLAAHLAIAPGTEAMPRVLPEPPLPDQTPAAQPTIAESSPPETHPAATDSSTSSHSEAAPADSIRPETLPPLRIALEQEMYVVRRGEPLLLRGELGAIAEHSGELPLQVRVRLYAPQNAQVLFDQAYPLRPAVLPLPFSCAVPLPHHYETYLMLGEVTVELVSTSAAPLATQSFKVTTDLHELLESFASQFAEGVNANSFADLTDLLPPLEPLSLPTERPGFVQPAVLPTVQFQPAQSVLPPQLRSNSSESGDALKERRIELPTFAQAPAVQDSDEDNPPVADKATAALPDATADASPVAEPSASAAIEPTPDASSIAAPSFEIGIAERSVTPAQPVSSSFSKPSDEMASSQPAPAARLPQGSSGFTVPQSGQSAGKSASKPLGETDPAADWQHVDSLKARKPASDTPLAPADIAFRSLNLQQRFLSRLQSLAGDRQLSASLQSHQTAPSNDADKPTVSVFDAKQPAPLDPRAQQPIGKDADLAQDEFVIDEGWEEMAAMQQRPFSPKPWLAAGSDSIPGLTLPPDAPLPVPLLHLPSENLISGSSVLVLVKLPDCPAKLAVKLWLIDRQSRLLLDGPHWLTDFTPDGFGQWMSRIELLLPQGYLEVQVEAISVEIMTQRESEKAAEARSIDPSLSQYSYDSIDV